MKNLLHESVMCRLIGQGVSLQGSLIEGTSDSKVTRLTVHAILGKFSTKQLVIELTKYFL